MSATVTIPSSRRASTGTMKWGVADVTMDSSYPTGGEAIDPADFGITTVWAVIVTPASGYVAEWDYENKKLKVMVPVKVVHNAAPSANSIDLIAADAGLEATTTGAANLDFVNQEVENGTDLSTLKFRVTMIGA